MGFYGHRRYDTGRWKSWRPITRAVIAGIAARNPLGSDTSRISSFCDNVGCNLVAGLIAIWHQRRRIRYYHQSLRTSTILMPMHETQTDTNPHASTNFSITSNLNRLKCNPFTNWKSHALLNKIFIFRICRLNHQRKIIPALLYFRYMNLYYWNRCKMMQTVGGEWSIDNYHQTRLMLPLSPHSPFDKYKYAQNCSNKKTKRDLLAGES